MNRYVPTEAEIAERAKILRDAIDKNVIADRSQARTYVYGWITGGFPALDQDPTAKRAAAVIVDIRAMLAAFDVVFPPADLAA